MAKALVLLSGGLDSTLAAKILMEQGVAVVGLSFFSYFTNPSKAREAAEELGIKLIEFDLSDAHLKMVKNPQYGYGKNMNPCIDCHGLMLKKARKIMNEEGYDFVATGEVLGQRPMSQNIDSLAIVSQISGIYDSVLRPLSAKLMSETRPEKEGLADRNKLLDIRGRSRARQFELAKQYGLKSYDSPASGCLLTDPEFSQRLIKMFGYWPDCDGNDVQLLKYGRVYWLSPMPPEDANERQIKEKVLIVVARNQEESEMLEKLNRSGDIVMELKDETGPTTLIRMPNIKTSLTRQELTIEVPPELKMSALNLGEEKSEEEILHIACLLTGYYAVKARGRKMKIKIREI